VDSPLLVRDHDLWVLALLAAAVSRRELDFGPLSIALGRHVAPSTNFLLAIVRIPGFWSMNASVSPSAFRDLHASLV